MYEKVSAYRDPTYDSRIDRAVRLLDSLKVTGCPERAPSLSDLSTLIDKSDKCHVYHHCRPGGAVD